MRTQEAQLTDWRCIESVARRIAGLLAALFLSACGGGGGAAPAIPVQVGGASSTTPYTPGVYQPSSSFAARCAAPRTGSDSRGRPFRDVQGSTTEENHWLRSWTNELYLWYREVPDLNPANYSSTIAYFDLLKTTAMSPSGQPKDKFHFTYPTAAWEALSQSGVEAGYGVQWVIRGTAPSRRILVAFTEPNSPATSAGLARGAEIMSVDNVTVATATAQANIDVLNAGLFPTVADQVHTFTVRDLSGTTRTLTMTSAIISATPVQNVRTFPTASGPVGYLLFNDHIATAESALINAVSTLKQAGITDLILDIRYNGGGYLAIASELAYMIAGSATAGREFERLTFNDKYPATDPVTGQPLSATPFHTRTQITSPSVALPTLGLQRVFVITGSGTCSASESIINGLRGIDFPVIQVGSTTCGKPYGFYPSDNCGTTYFSIQFKGENAKRFGEYSDGFSPANTATAAGERVPGCSVADDLTRALGDVSEGRIAAALSYRDSNGASCPAPTGAAPGSQLKSTQPSSDGVLPKAPWRENRILRHGG